MIQTDISCGWVLCTSGQYEGRLHYLEKTNWFFDGDEEQQTYGPKDLTGTGLIWGRVEVALLPPSFPLPSDNTGCRAGIRESFAIPTSFTGDSFTDLFSDEADAGLSWETLLLSGLSMFISLKI
jgi:hypothetical protein